MLALLAAGVLVAAAGCGGTRNGGGPGQASAPPVTASQRPLPTPRPVASEIDDVDTTLAAIDGSLSSLDSGLQANPEDGQ